MSETADLMRMPAAATVPLPAAMLDPKFYITGEQRTYITPTSSDVAHRTADGMEACQQAAEKIRSISATITSMATEIHIASEAVAEDFERRAAELAKLVEGFTALQERHSELIDQLHNAVHELGGQAGVAARSVAGQ